LYSSLNDITVTKPKRMRAAGYVSRVGDVRNAQKFLVDKT